MAFAVPTGSLSSLTEAIDYRAHIAGASVRLRKTLSAAGLEIIEEGFDDFGPFVGWRFPGSEADPIRAYIEIEDVEVIGF